MNTPATATAIPAARTNRLEMVDMVGPSRAPRFERRRLEGTYAHWGGTGDAKSPYGTTIFAVAAWNRGSSFMASKTGSGGYREGRPKPFSAAISSQCSALSFSPRAA